MANTFNHNDKVVITDGGSVGIGTTSPTRTLHVAGTGRFTDNLYSTSTDVDGIKTRFLSGAANNSTNNGTLYLQYGKSNPVSIGETGSSDLYVAGNVGIGTTSPTQKLDVDGTGRFDAIELVNGGGSTTRGLFSDGTQGEVTLISPERVTVLFDSNNNDTNSFFAVKKDATDPSNATELFRVDSSGNVGIGTTSPTTKLYVDAGESTFNRGNSAGAIARFRGQNAEKAVIGTADSWFSSNVGIGTTSPAVKLQVSGNASVGTIGTPKSDWWSAFNSIQIGDGTTLWGRASDTHLSSNYYVKDNSGIAQDTYINTNYANDFWLDNSDGTLIYRNAASGTAGTAITWNTRLKILNNGNVGIGTVSPETRLHLLTSTTDATQQLLIQNGSTGDAAIKFNISGDTYSIGIDNSDSDKFKLSYGSLGTSDRIVVDSTGNVGIGTTSPDSKLHIESSSATGANLILETTHSSGIPLLDLKGSHSAQLRYKDELDVIQGRIDFGDSGIFNFIDVPNNSSTLYLKSGGNVGIGTTSPSEKFVVNGPVVWQGALVASQTNSGVLDRSGNDLRIRAYGATAGTGNLVFRTGGGGGSVDSEAMRITSGGNVGIGTTTPLGRLDVRQAQSTTAFTNPFLKLYPSSTVNATGLTTITLGTSPLDNYGVSLSGWRYQSDGAPKFIIKMHQNSASGIDALTIDTSGNVGIGTTSPSQKLHVNGNAQIDYSILGRGIRSAGRGELHLNSQGADDVSEIFFGYGNGYSENNIRWGISDRGNTTGQLNFYVGPALGGFTSALSLYENLNSSFYGNVGIGTTSPSAKLHVSSTSTEPMRIYGDSGGTNGLFRIQMDSVSDSFASGARTFLGDGGTDIILGTANSSYTPNNSYIALNHSGSIHMGAGASPGLDVTINTDGSVGIGTTGPSAKLHVVGPQQTASAKATGAIIQQQYYDPGSGGQLISSSLTLRTTSAFGDNWASGAIVGLVGNPGDTSNYPGGLAFYTKPKGTVSTDVVEAMRVSYDGNVGIGTTNPTLSPTSYTGGLHVENDTYIQARLSSSSSGAGLEFIPSSGDHWEIQAQNGSSLIFYNRTDSSYRMVIDGSGNVGIGTTSPAYKLQVSGGAISIKGNAAGNSLRFDDSGGTSRNAMYLDTSNYLNVGNSNYAGIKLIHTAVAPQANALEGNQIAEAFGTTDNGVVLAEPDAWLAVRVGTTDYAIPMYITG